MPWFVIVGANDSIWGLFFLTGHTGSQRWENWEPPGIQAQYPWCIKGKTATHRRERSSI